MLQDLCVRAMPPTVPAKSLEAAFFPTPGPEHTSHLAAMAERRFSAGVVSCFANGGCPLYRERPPKVEMLHPFEAKGRRALPTGTKKRQCPSGEKIRPPYCPWQEVRAPWTPASSPVKQPLLARASTWPSGSGREGTCSAAESLSKHALRPRARTRVSGLASVGPWQPRVVASDPSGAVHLSSPLT